MTHGTCICKTGYYRASGSRSCEVDCKASFCHNGGACEKGPNGRVCKCTDGYSGIQCQTEKKTNVALIVGCTAAAVFLLIVLGVVIYKSKNKAQRKGFQLNNRTSPDSSPKYPVRAFSNQTAKDSDYDIPMDSKIGEHGTPMLTHAFTNKIANESVAAEEHGEKKDSSM